MERGIERIATRALESLTSYDWPGNIRELKNAIERSVVLRGGPEFHLGSKVDPHLWPCTSGVRM
jgi:DNA-binding NtrC family response regulator